MPVLDWETLSINEWNELTVDDWDTLVASQSAAALLDPSVLKPGLLTGSDLNAGMTTPLYLGGLAETQHLKPGLLDNDGNLKPSLKDGEGNLKPSLLK